MPVSLKLYTAIIAVVLLDWLSIHHWDASEFHRSTSEAPKLSSTMAIHFSHPSNSLKNLNISRRAAFPGFIYFFFFSRVFKLFFIVRNSFLNFTENSSSSHLEDVWILVGCGSWPTVVEHWWIGEGRDNTEWWAPSLLGPRWWRHHESLV